MHKYFDFATFDGRTKFVLMLVLGVAVGLGAMPVLAASAVEAEQTINWWHMGMTLLGAWPCSCTVWSRWPRP